MVWRVPPSPSRPCTWWIPRSFQESDAVPLFRGFAVPDGFVWDTSIWLLVIGGLVGMIGSAMAVTRFTDV